MPDSFPPMVVSLLRYMSRQKGRDILLAGDASGGVRYFETRHVRYAFPPDPEIFQGFRACHRR